MLCQLSINNFAIVRFLELDFHSGMTSITGETGAGKSIAIDALSLCLGNRCDINTISVGANKAEVSARFSLNDVPSANRWLQLNDLEQENEECILRRVISRDGRSRAYINGIPVTLSQLKSIGQLLIGIHGQHAHHAMLKAEHQLALVDNYASHQLLLKNVKESYLTYKRTESELKKRQSLAEHKKARKQLLQYQVEELDEFDLKLGEFEEIEQEHKKLANGSALVDTCQQMLHLLNENEDNNIESLINKSLLLGSELENYDSSLAPVHNMLNDALILIQESTSEIAHYQNSLELDPEYFSILENRLSQAMQLARKHLVPTSELACYHQKLRDELKSIDNDEQELSELEINLTLCKNKYFEKAKLLSENRQIFAKKLATKVTKSIHQLNMPSGKFEISVVFNPENMSDNGSDNLCFLVATNPGQPLQPLSKIVSGGELSRIGLCIQVITAKKVATPTLIFDEVDVGISGATAAIVGKMLRTLGESTQVLCVTHLPQVAGNGHQHMYVSKTNKINETETSMVTLTQQQRIQELARLLGGNSITENTLANAQELLQQT